MSNQSLVSSYQYNGLGDRLRETVNGNPTTFTMDLNTGLTQALSDGTNTYIYGNGRIAQAAGTSTEHFLGDALGSVRQLTNGSGAITYAKAYDPYGVVTSTLGSSQSAYGYTNEYTSQGLVYLRARMYAPSMGRFLTRDTWMGDYDRPLSLNRWMYVEGNPVNATDPSGYITVNESSHAIKILKELKSKYDITIPRDWGYRLYDQILPNYSDETFGFLSDCQWTDGNWRSLKELQLTRDGIEAMATKMGGVGSFAWAMEAPVTIRRMPEDHYSNNGHDYVAWTVLDIKLYNDTFNGSEIFAKGTVVHELAHVWDTRQLPIFRLSTNMISKTKSYKEVCTTTHNGHKACWWVYDQSGANLEQSPTPYGQSGPREDFADSFAICVYPGFKNVPSLNLYSIRKDYIEGLLNVLHGNKCS